MKKFISFCVLSGILILTTALHSCSKSGSSYGSTTNSGGNGSTTNKISIINMAFSPSSTTVVKGTTVTWTNNDVVTHTVTADDNSFNSGDLAPGKSYSMTFSSAGSVYYHCSIHTGMKGTVIVN